MFLLLLSGFLFFLLGFFVVRIFSPRPGARLLLWLHFFIGFFFVLQGVVNGESLAILRSLLLALIPATLLHFTFIFVEVFESPPPRFSLIAPYLFGFGLFALSMRIAQGELFLILYWVFAYLFSLIACGRRLSALRRDPDRTAKGYFFQGLLIGFLLPLISLTSTAFGMTLLPLSWVAPTILLFPGMLLMGLLIGRHREVQSYQIQHEKRTSFGGFLAGLAHELNNPLNFIYANIDPYKDRLKKLRDSLLPHDTKSAALIEELEQMTGQMEEGAKRSKNLVESFRHFPSAEVAGPKVLVDLNEILEKTIELLSPKWKGRLTVETDLQNSRKILGRAGELAQVFTNLIANACEATPEGGSVFVSSHEGVSGVKVVIQDTGKGIPKELIGKIFDPFFTTKGPQEGTGLGLAISLQIIKSHKGSIEVRSEVGKGTEFVIVLPYE